MNRAWILIAVALAATLALAIPPPVPQPEAYHHLADTRHVAGIPNAANVLANLGFLGGGFVARSAP